MAERKRFKFQSSSKIAKSIRLSAFDEIVSFIAKDGSRNCFRITLTNLLRLKDLLKFQAELRELQRSDFFANTNIYGDEEDVQSDCYRKPLEVLLDCSKRASPMELEYLCRLLSAFYKDFGDVCGLRAPFDDLLELMEANSNLNSKPIFMFVLTYFRVHTSHILSNIDSVLKDFFPWLNNRNPLIKRLSMESLGMLLRRAPIQTIKQVVVLCIHMDGAEKIIFSIVQNIDGSFTSKIQSLFTFLFHELIPATDKDLERVAENIRSTIVAMSHHAKDTKLDLSWLKQSYDQSLKRFSQDLPPTDFKAHCILMELTLEMLITFEETKFTTPKNYPLITDRDLFALVLGEFVLPLLRFSNRARKGHLFEDLCSYLLRAVRSEAECISVLEREFGAFLRNIDHNLVGMNNINSFLSLFEWRLKTGDLTQISHILLVFASILNTKDIFHPLIINPLILDRVLSSIDSILTALEAGEHESDSYLNLFGIVYGLSSINKVRLKLKASKMENNDTLFHRLLTLVLEGLKLGYDSRVLVKLYTITLALTTKDRDPWVEKLAALGSELDLFHNYFLLEFLVDNYSGSLDSLIHRVLDQLPRENHLVRVNALKLVKMHFERTEPELAKYLDSLLEIESLPNDVENARKKCMAMERAVNAIDFECIRKLDYAMVALVFKKVLLSQYYVKFSPLWEGAFKANCSLLYKLKGYEKSLKATWELYFHYLKDMSLPRPVEFTNEMVESALEYKTCERTDPVTIQFHVLRVISEIVSGVKDKDEKIRQLVEYTLGQFQGCTDFLRNAICTLSAIFTKFTKQEPGDELLNCCATLGLKSRDTKVREASLTILAKKHKIDPKRLLEICTGNFQQVAALASSSAHVTLEGESEEEARQLNLSVGIEIRLIAPRIYQHSNFSHGTALIDYFLNFDAKYVSLLLIELLPNEYARPFLPPEPGKPFEWMFDTLKFAESPYSLHLPNVLTTLNLIVRRLLNHLRPQSLPLMELCCILLRDNASLPTEDSSIVLERSLKIMAELVGTFGTGHFIDTLSHYCEVIVALSHRVGLELVLSCTSQLEHIDEFCTRVISSLFPGIFKDKLTQRHIALANNIYNLYPAHLKRRELSPSAKMEAIMLDSAEPLLDSMLAHGNYNCDLLACLVALDLGDAVKLKALGILLSSLPSRGAMNKAVTLDSKADLELWKKILGSLDACLFLLGTEDSDSVDRIWEFVDNVLSLVPDNRCRRMAATLLTKIPSKDDGVAYVGAHLCSMNGVSVELRLDLDLNVEVISDIVQDLDSRELSFRCINTLLAHALFLLHNHQRDPGVRRCVAALSFKVLQLVKTRLSGATALDLGRFADPTFILSNTLFPFMRRSLAGKAEDSLVCLCLEFLEQYVRLFSDVPDSPTIFAAVHGDLLSNPAVADLFHSIRELQKYKRCKGLKQLQTMVESNSFSNSTLLKIVVPTALQFLVQRNAVRHAGLSDMSKQCLIAACRLLPMPSFVKILKRLLQTYGTSKLQVVLSVFAAITKSRVQTLPPHPDTEQSFKDEFGLAPILSRLKKMSLVPGSRNLGDVPVVGVFECLGHLLGFYPDAIVNRELIKQCRILCKFLISRNRDVRRLARISLINLAKPFRARYIDVFIRELFTNMTKGYKCSVLIFTIYAILNRVLDEEHLLTPQNNLGLLYTMILDELSRGQEKDDSNSKIDEARHPKSSQLISLMSQYALQEVVERNYTFLLALLSGKLVSHKTGHLDYSDKFLRKVNELIVSATSGLILNKKVDRVGVCFKIFITALPRVRGIEKSSDQFPAEVVEAYHRFTQIDQHTVSDYLEIAKPEPKSVENDTDAGSHRSRLKERLTVMPGASTGRSFESSLKKPGFENRIFAPLFVNSALRLFNNIIAGEGVCPDLGNGVRENCVVDKAEGGDLETRALYRLCEFCVLTSFLSEDVVLQKSSCTCLLNLCKLRPSLIEDFGLVLASNLVDRMGSLDLVGSEELAKDHIGLISIFFNSRNLDLLLEAWHISNRKGKLVESLLLQIETNLNRPRLHTPLFKLLLVLMQSTIKTNVYTPNSSSLNTMLATPSTRPKLLNGLKSKGAPKEALNGDKGSNDTAVYFDKEFYTVTYEIMIRMLKGNVATKSVSLVSKVVGHSFVLLPMDEATRSKRFALLLKHVNASDPQVRLATIKSLLVIMKELPGHVVWKRYASLVTLALLPQLVSEDDVQCRKFLQALVTHIWSVGNRENKNELLDVVAHFVRKMKKHVHLAFSFFVYLSLKNETSLHNLNRLDLSTVTSFLDDINADHWQNCYYWLMLLEHLLSIQFDLGREPASKIWRFVLDVGLSSQHPWVLASSLRVFSHVLKLKLHELVPGFGSRVFALLKTSFRNLSTYFPYLERHRKLEQATLDVMLGCCDVLAQSRDKSLERLTSRLCYILRCDLGRKSECKRRICVLLQVFAHLATKPVVYEPRSRVMLLKLIIALFRVAHTKPAGVSHRLKKLKEPEDSHADTASGILERIEESFAHAPAEHLRLLSFARNYVLKSRLVKKKQVALAMVTNTKMAALRKMRRNRKKRKKISR